MLTTSIPDLVPTTIEKSCPLRVANLATEELDTRRQGGVGFLKKRTHVATERGRLESTLRCGQLVGLKPA